jgi:hypothetical protein
MRYRTAEQLEIIRAIVAISAAHASPARDPAFDFLPLVRTLYGARRDFAT